MFLVTAIRPSISGRWPGCSINSSSRLWTCSTGTCSTLIHDPLPWIRCHCARHDRLVRAGSSHRRESLLITPPRRLLRRHGFLDEPRAGNSNSARPSPAPVHTDCSTIGYRDFRASVIRNALVSCSSSDWLRSWPQGFHDSETWVARGSLTSLASSF